MRHTVKQLNEIIELWSKKYALSAAIVALPEVYMKIEKYLQFFNERELESFNNISNRKRKASRIAGRLAVRTALARFDPEQFFSNSASTIEILNDNHGKPYLTKYKDICVSISHSGACAIAAVSKKRIGVDIEQIEKRPDCFITTFFLPSEQKWIKRTGMDFDCRANYLWTRKEAVSKLLGVGGSVPFRSIPVLEGESEYIFESHQLPSYSISLALQKEIT